MYHLPVGILSCCKYIPTGQGVADTKKPKCYGCVELNNSSFTHLVTVLDSYLFHSSSHSFTHF